MSGDRSYISHNFPFPHDLDMPPFGYTPVPMVTLPLSSYEELRDAVKKQVEDLDALRAERNKALADLKKATSQDSVILKMVTKHVGDKIYDWIQETRKSLCPNAEESAQLTIEHIGTVAVISVKQQSSTLRWSKKLTIVITVQNDKPEPSMWAEVALHNNGDSEAAIVQKIAVKNIEPKVHMIRTDLLVGLLTP